jgi:hypothetical protein
VELRLALLEQLFLKQWVCPLLLPSQQLLERQL